jgi:UDP-N-acetylmuramoylalanine--D-glutamate ligase
MGASTRLPRLPADFRPTDLRGQRVLVVGLGSFGGGLGAARHLAREGAEVLVNDLRPASELEASIAPLRGMAVRFVLGRHAVEEVGQVDWVVASPAVKWSAPPLVEAVRRGIPVESEITLLVRLLPCRWLGITGTNGKSTTTMLAGRTLAAAGRRVWSGGNLGGSLLEELPTIDRDDAVVLELSSFQLEHLEETGLGPTVGLVTNVTPDHLDRHGSFEAYAAAKRAILVRAETAVLNRGCASCRSFAKWFLERRRGEDPPVELRWYGEERDFGSVEAGSFLRDGGVGVIRSADGRELSFDLASMALRGSHNRVNLLAAATAANCFGVPFDAAIRAGCDAPPLRQRLNEIARIRDVLYVDDSVSTSPPAVIAALRSFGAGIRLLAGGYDKGIDPAPLVAAMLERCTKAYLYGAAGPALAEQLSRAATAANGAAAQPCSWEVFGDLRDAFTAASRESRRGDTVLLSPGFASYDQFRNFTERGDLFRDLVKSLRGAAVGA